MDQFQNMQSGQGLLKTDYDEGDAMSQALKKKRMALADNKRLVEKSEDEKIDDQAGPIY